MILTILAAGRATRYGALKQLEGFGPYGELLLDYAIYDAYQAGYEKVVLVIRRDIEALFREKMVKHCLYGTMNIEYAFQEEPLGIADAVRSALPLLDQSFSVINADDFYGGVEVYRQAIAFTKTDALKGLDQYGVIAYPAARTLSANGKVSRGICISDDSYNLVRVEAQFEFEREANEQIKGRDADGNEVFLADDTLCSMGFWIFPVAFGGKLRKSFQEYQKHSLVAGRAGEFHIDDVVQNAIDSSEATIKVLPAANVNWCGVTHPGDRERVCSRLSHLHEHGVYPRLRM